MYCVSTQGVDERMINVHYYYYPIHHKIKQPTSQQSNQFQFHPKPTHLVFLVQVELLDHDGVFVDPLGHVLQDGLNDQQGWDRACDRDIELYANTTE